MGGIHEQFEITGRGTDTGRTNLQLTLFPTEEEQIQRTAESKMPSAFSLSLAEIEHELLRGTGTQDGKSRVHQLYQAMPDRKTAIDFLKQEYGFYGHSHTFIDGTSGFIDYQPSRGMVIQHYHSNNKVALKWDDIEKHLRALVMADRYLTAEEKNELESREKASAGLDTTLQEHELVQPPTIPYAPGDTVYLENNTAFIIEKIGQHDVTLRDPSLFYPILRAESRIQTFLY